ncbi:uncharacterized protein PFL1_01787 [Pseudozyma flocculosa PF-1]|uniref:Fe2OG dioxygenase domain-containing protein n=1 Tax=Pseudozyma flocculosa TaxID=84751 RepID=A0A5C3F0E5_9BASI|nr:uncharacterized protein PFL1_01787 [Pseudozyma flocculosa PF-1]EPQ30890.1 hypothetical protein PFL1_01787 [Pseudozyma flocculosa PF-1]SPO36731.1 uncharacterized protein PSFLO_02202 [Pseudozyma flocculosa]
MSDQSGSDGDGDTDSLFSSSSLSSAPGSPRDVAAQTAEEGSFRIASRRAPAVPGLLFFPDLLSASLCSDVVSSVADCGYFTDEVVGRNQAMLFARARPSECRPRRDTIDPPGDRSKRRKVEGEADEADHGGLPAWVTRLIAELERKLDGLVDDELHRLLFAPRLRPPAERTSTHAKTDAETALRSRQLILNLYRPGEGLSSHVDLMRFGDGIMLASFGAPQRGVVMEFTRVAQDQHAEQTIVHSLFLPSGSLLILSGEARYDWKHGIPARRFDLVRDDDDDDDDDSAVRLERGTRLSVTIRWMGEGGDVVGHEDADSLASGPVPG